jgi:RHS repeat-associated protein
MRFGTSFAGALILSLGAQLGSITPSSAQSLPSGCVPAGSTYECLDVMEEPWDYTHNTCGTHEYRANEAESFQDELNTWTNVCDLQTTRIGWYTTPSTVGFCGIQSGAPEYNWGVEVNNTSRYTFIYRQTCGSALIEELNNAVIRKRGVFCPQGYGIYSSGGVTRCRRAVASREPQKSLGCPTDSCAGNPINPAIGNKYQEETDYQADGKDGLLVRRYYNSAMDFVKSGHVASFYSVSQTWKGATGWLGYSQFGKLAMQDESARYRLMAMDAIGAHWRHHYQRAIHLESSSSITTAMAYRHDGKVTTFNLYLGNFVAQADISDRLIQLPDGRFQYTVASSESVETYLPDGHLESIRSRSGLTQTIAYDACDRIATVTDDFGRQLHFNYDHDCSSASRIYRITSITTPSGQVIGYSYNSSTGTLTSVTYPDSTVRGYTYGGFNGRLLTGIVDESGSTYAIWSYDSDGRAISSQHASGADSVTVSYASGSQFWNVSQATVTDSLGSITKHYYSSVRGTARVTRIEQPHPSGTGTASRWFTYDTNGNVATFQNRRTYKTSYTYDLTRNLETSRTEGLNSNGTSSPESRTITTQWHATYRLPTVITETGRTTAFTYDSSGNRLTRTVTDTATYASRTWAWTYDAYGRLLTEDGPRTDVADVTTYTYYTCTSGYQCGQMATVTNAAGHVTTYSTYNAHGQPLTIIDPNNVLTTLTYDARQRLTSRNVGGEVTSLVYWPTGLLKRVTSADGSYVEYTYDAAHRLTQIADDENNRVAYTLDAMGNRIQEQSLDGSSAIARKHYRTVDFLNLIKEEIGSANAPNVTTALTYDNNANLKTVTAPLGRVTVNSYDRLDRLTQTTNPASGVTVYSYNARDDLLSVTDPRGLVTSYAYNGFGDVTQLTSPDTGVTGTGYNSGGNVQTRTDALGQVGTYSHDSLNRVSSTVFSDQTISYAYDSGINGVGRLASIADNSGSTSWAYTAQGRVATRTQITAGLTQNVGYGYDSAGRLSTLTYPSGIVVTYGYTGGKVTSVTSGSETFLTGVVYDPFGPVRGWTWGNSTQMVRTYDLDGNIDQVDSGGLKTYTQDDAFRITAITDTVDSSKSWSYGYDLLDRLTTANRTGYSQGWTYDANGNRLSQTGSAPSTYSLAGSSNRLNSVSGSLSRSFGYDATGNATTNGATTFAYDAAGRMVSATTGGTTTTFDLNALGQRVRKTTSSVSTLFVYDESGHLLGEYASTGALIREYVWLNDTPIVVVTGGPGTPPFIYWYIHTDHLDAPRSVENSTTGQLVWRWDFAPFGEFMPDQDPDGDSVLFTLPLRFPGQFYDSETGLHYNYFRDYDPAIGRYVQSDPIGLEGGITTTYGYVNGNPITYRDTLGLRVDWGDFRFHNPLVLWNIRQLNREIVARGFNDDCFIIRVTGGDRYMDPDDPKIHRSATNHSIVPGSDPNSPHLRERFLRDGRMRGGARAADFVLENVTNCRCYQSRPVTNADVDSALAKTAFAPGNTSRDYPDNPHSHVALPPSLKFFAPTWE